MSVAIRKAVKDRLYLEAENGCGFCGSRDMKALTIHHMEHSGTIDNSYDNLIVLCHNCHTRYHQKKGITKKEIVEVKRRLILKTLTPLGLNALKLCYRKSFIAGNPFTLLHLVELGFIKKYDVNSWTSLEDNGKTVVEIEMNVIYKITQKGKEFYKKWKL